MRKGKATDQASCITRASLGVELGNFKTLVRYIIANNASSDHQPLFKPDQRFHLRRLKQFAIIGHQPGINAVRVTTEAMRRQVEESIMRQRAGASPKHAVATMRTVHAKRDEGELCSIKLKRAKVDTRSLPQWSRSFRTGAILPVTRQTPYMSRIITCRACGHGKETAHMQLKMASGFRGIVCPGCHRQARVGLNLCQCKVIWHQCTTHQHDPAIHRSAKPANQASAQVTAEQKVKRLSLHRAAPEALQRKPVKRSRVQVHSGTRLHAHGLVTCLAQRVPKLDVTEHPQLAAKFPHLTTQQSAA
jgi:hypothetical protein